MKTSECGEFRQPNGNTGASYLIRNRIYNDQLEDRIVEQAGRHYAPGDQFAVTVCQAVSLQPNAERFTRSSAEAECESSIVQR